MRPVNSDGVWWHLSRGRMVLGGELAPSRALLAAESTFEADWLAGLPGYVCYRVAGESGLMLWRLLAAAALAMIAWRWFARWNPALRVWLAAATLLLTHAAWDPSPLLWSVLGVWLVDQLVYRPTTWFALPVVMACWANIAPLPALGLAVFALHPGRHARTMFRWLGVLALMALALCLTPRGPGIWWDGLVELLPQLFVEHAVLAETSFQSIWRAPHAMEFAVWLFLAVVALVSIVWQPGKMRGHAVALAVSALAAGMCRENIPATGFWLASIVARLNPQGDTASVRPSRAIVTCLPMVALTLFLAAGCIPHSPQRLGWGITPRLDLASLAEAWQHAPLEGHIFCLDRHSAGAASWLAEGRRKAWDEPRRALLGGRLREHVLLCHDLAQRREAGFYRTDGSEGGWRAALARRQIVGLVIPIERTDLIAGLAESHWRPLSLASLLVPYGQAGDPYASPAIVQMLKQDDLISRGPWSAGLLPRFGSSSHVDLWGLVFGRPDPTTALAQARMFQSRGMSVAALRLLFPVMRELPSRVSDSLFRRLQDDLAWSEHLQIGQVSSLRRLASARQEVPSDWAAAIGAYNAGVPAQAASELKISGAQADYARGWWRWEAGDTAAASVEFNRLLNQHPDHPLRVLASHALSQIALPR